MLRPGFEVRGPIVARLEHPRRGPKLVRAGDMDAIRRTGIFEFGYSGKIRRLTRRWRDEGWKLLGIEEGPTREQPRSELGDLLEALGADPLWSAWDMVETMEWGDGSAIDRRLDA